MLEHEGSAAKEDAQEDSANCDITKAGSAEQDVVESAAAATAAANASEIEELTQAFKQVKTKLADELESNCQEKKELETNLVSTTHQLLEVKHNLSLAEKVKLAFKFDWPKARNVLLYPFVTSILYTKTRYLTGTGEKI